MIVAVKRPAVWKCLMLPDGQRLIVSSHYENKERLSVYDENHNIFRLDAAGNVLWQIERNEGVVEEGFGGLRRAAERGETDAESGFLSGIEPFMCFILHYPDGRNNIDPNTGEPPDCAIWEPGVQVRTSSLSGWPYDVDIERGVARNIATRPIRPW
ncbi:MAG: hypothetical protein WC023_11940 [Rhodocyclaceae bacterium]